jgi:myosin-crossreactive antigen
MPPEIIEYEILYWKSHIDLRRTVNEYISKGWQPFSGITYDTYNYYQAMVKYKLLTP